MLVFVEPGHRSVLAGPVQRESVEGAAEFGGAMHLQPENAIATPWMGARRLNVWLPEEEMRTLQAETRDRSGIKAGRRQSRPQGAPERGAAGERPWDRCEDLRHTLPGPQVPHPIGVAQPVPEKQSLRQTVQKRDERAVTCTTPLLQL